MFKHSILCFAALSILFTACKKEETPFPENPSQPIITSPGQVLFEEVVRNPGSEKVLHSDGKTFITGFTQLGNRQNAYALCIMNDDVRWQTYYDKSPDDSRGVALAANGNELFIAFTCTGGNTELKATAGAFQQSYGQGGGAKIVFLARIDASTGRIRNATFIGGKLNNGNTNTLRPEDGNMTPISFLPGNKIQFMATKAYDRGDGRLTPNIGPDEDCMVSGGTWQGIFDYELRLHQGNCFP
jgi:hypothetical protein